MNESNIVRTAIFFGVALLLTLITWLTGPADVEQSSEDMVGRELFPDFESPLDATSLEVVKYDENLGGPFAFKVARLDNRWSIPSHSNYPADAKDQLAEVASELMDLEVLQAPVEIDDIKSFHETYGVIDPTDEAAIETDAMGTLVTMENADGDVLLKLIVGKEVPDSRGLRYVRRLGEDAVFAVELRADRISTKFEDWIEDDLLQLSSWDIKQLFIDDYSIDILQGVLHPRGRMRIEYDDAGDPRWKMLLDEEMNPESREYVERTLAEDEELNADALNDLKQAVDDLTIVDVVRKSEGLIENLQATGYYNMVMTQLQPLSRQGFHFVSAGQDSQGQTYCELRSTEGDIHISMKTGVQYILRFGRSTTLGTNDTDDESDESDESGESGESDESDGDSSADTENADGEEETAPAGLSRYLFVMAKLDESVIPPPDLLDPPTPPAGPATGPPTTPDAAAPTTPDATAPTTPDGAEVPPAAEEPAQPAPAEPTQPADGVPPGDNGQTSAPVEAEPQPPVIDPPAAGDSPAEGPAPVEDMGAVSEEPSEYEKELERVETHNKREQEEYDEKVTEAREEVDKLNARFADWYYIISDETYQKIHLGRSDIVQVKEPEESETPGVGVGGFPMDSPFVEMTDGASISDFEALKANPPGGGE